jgi:hypothetical protein
VVALVLEVQLPKARAAAVLVLFMAQVEHLHFPALLLMLIVLVVAGLGRLHGAATAVAVLLSPEVAGVLARAEVAVVMAAREAALGQRLMVVLLLVQVCLAQEPLQPYQQPQAHLPKMYFYD